MGFTTIDAIEFFQDSRKHIRVYYQSRDATIRESSFEAGAGWFTRGDGIVATTAKIKTPITATRWNMGNETQIRLYFLDNQNNICECQGQHISGVTTWQSSIILQNGNVAAGSKLAVARPETDDTKLRLFYQENPDASGKHPVREIMYYRGRRGRANWQVEGAKIFDALENSSLSAISARPFGDVRLYYQGDGNTIWESFWDASRARWANATSLRPEYRLVPNAPISAVGWYNNNITDSLNLRIRIYTILEVSSNQITELSYQQGWDDDTDNAVTQNLYIPGTPPQEYPSVATSRDTKADPYRPICVFYQSGSNVIDMTAVAADDEPQYQTEAANVVTPKGIPKSLGAALAAPGPTVNPIPQPPGTTNNQDQVSQLTAELASKDSEIARLTGILAANSTGGISPSDFGSNLTTWQEVKDDHNRIVSELATTQTALSQERTARQAAEEKGRQGDAYATRIRTGFGWADAVYYIEASRFLGQELSVRRYLRGLGFKYVPFHENWFIYRDPEDA